MLVMAKLRRQRLTEMEIIGISAASEESGKAVQTLLERYRGEIFPGRKKDARQEDAFEVQAKAMLAAEAQKVYLVKPAQQGLGSQELKAALNSENPELRAFAAREVKNELMAKARLKNKGKSRRDLPPGIFHQGKQ